MKIAYSIAAAALLVSGCASTKFASPTQPGVANSVVVTAASALPAPADLDTSSGDIPYRIGAFDKLKIDVLGIPDMSKVEIQVDSGGRISFPLVGSLIANGKTPVELSAAIADGLSRYIRQPRVTVNVEEIVSQQITVDGAVQEPGQYPVAGRMTLMRAIARAKGLTEYAKTTEVAVFRTVGTQQMAAVYSLKAIREGRYGDPDIYTNDVIVVGDSQVRHLFRDLLVAAPLITTPLILLLQ